MIDEDKPIVECKILRGDGMFDTPDVRIRQEGDESFHTLFTYYPDEISFTESELVGLTPKEAHHLKYTKDVAFLRS